MITQYSLLMVHFFRYVDGVLLNSTTFGTMLLKDGAGKELFLGTFSQGYQYPFIGVMDEVRIYNRAIY